MDRISEEADARLRLLPPIRRARLWRLYADGKAEGLPGRFLDLWMDGGRSILGAKGTGLGTAAKAAIDMGLARPLPSVWEQRLEKALLAAYPGYAGARFFRNEDRALAALAALLGRAPAVLDPARRGRGPAATPNPVDALVLRPLADYLPRTEGAGAIPYGLPVLPCPSTFAPGVVLFRAGAGAPGGELAPPLALAAAARALRELAKLASACGEPLWRRADRRLGPFLERSGPYLYPRHGEAEHDGFFRKALEAGLLVSPEYSLPSILPPDFDDGELAALGRAIRT